MHMLLFALLLFAQTPQITVAMPRETSPDSPTGIEVEPDAIPRGTSTTLIVVGEDVEQLKTLKIAPPDGVRIGAIEPQPIDSLGRLSVSVTVSVDANAVPGDREVVLTVAPAIAAPPMRGTKDANMQKIEQFMKEVMQRETKDVAMGSIHINSHDIQIDRMQVLRGKVNSVIEIVAADERGDVIVGDVGTELTCGNEPLMAIPQKGRIVSREGSRTTLSYVADLTATLGRECELRMRIQDSEGNRSPWITYTLRAK